MTRILTFILALVSSAASGQYTSGITFPDTTQEIITDINDPSVEFAATITAEDLNKRLSVIASDKFEGRETGEPGNDLAAQYLAGQFSVMGIKPIGPERSMFQQVAFTFSKWIDTDMYVNGVRFKHLWDYLSFPNMNESRPFLETDEIYFLGFGIEDEKYNDFKKKVKDKVIMINKGEPTKADGTYWITGTDQPSDWSTNIERKLIAAKKHGAKLVLIIEDDIKGMLAENRRKLLGSVVELGDKTLEEIPYANHAYISTTIAKALIGDQSKKIIKSRSYTTKKGKNCDVKLKPTLVFNQTNERKVLSGRNVMAYIEGTDKKDEVIVVSAHYDHLGKRGDDIYNGADDNGSGTSGVLEIAEAFTRAKNSNKGPRRSLLFLLVTGEEKGLLGSEFYANEPIFPLENTVADVNIDMIGRVNEKYVDNPEYIFVIGSDRLSSDLHKINEEMNQKYSHLVLDYEYNSEDDPNRYYTRSDHYNFAKNGVPAIFFFSGTHEDYHRPTDTVEKINFKKMEKVTRHIFHTIWELANRDDRIVVDGEVK